MRALEVLWDGVVAERLAQDRGWDMGFAYSAE